MLMKRRDIIRKRKQEKRKQQLNLILKGLTATSLVATTTVNYPSIGYAASATVIEWLGRKVDEVKPDLKKAIDNGDCYYTIRKGDTLGVIALALNDIYDVENKELQPITWEELKEINQIKDELKIPVDTKIEIRYEVIKKLEDKPACDLGLESKSELVGTTSSIINDSYKNPAPTTTETGVKPAKPVAEVTTEAKPVVETPSEVKPTTPEKPVAETTTQAPAKPVVEETTKAPAQPVVEETTQAPAKPVTETTTVAPTKPVVEETTVAVKVATTYFYDEKGTFIKSIDGDVNGLSGYTIISEEKVHDIKVVMVKVNQVPAKPVVEETTQAPAKPVVEETTQAPVKPVVEETTQAPAKPVVEETTQAPAKPVAEETTTAPQPAEPAKPVVSFMDQLQDAFLNLVNTDRRAKGLHELKLGTHLAQGAQTRADELAEAGTIRPGGKAHYRPNGEWNATAFSYLPDYGTAALGENTASTYSLPAGNTTPNMAAEQAFNQWKSSTGHYNSMMSPTKTHTYLGYATKTQELPDQTRNFTVFVETFYASEEDYWKLSDAVRAGQPTTSVVLSDSADAVDSTTEAPVTEEVTTAAAPVAETVTEAPVVTESVTEALVTEVVDSTEVPVVEETVAPVTEAPQTEVITTESLIIEIPATDSAN